jgi:hypothetical protein
MRNQEISAKKFVEDAFKEAQDAIDASVSVHVWGGKFKREERPLSTFLNVWNSKESPQFQWSMVEHVNYFRAEQANMTKLAQEASLTERLRLFGEAGDLDIRRDGETIYWRFMSEQPIKLPDLSDFGVEECLEKGSSFAKQEQSYLLWRRDKKEQRVKHDWVQGEKWTHLKQVQYLDNGRVAFVRCVRFEEVTNE